ncbi:type II toxin-antitoxin system Phd/YefM family antitoxin [Candidatus Chlorohelix sp.]|uniref:type II toxin-antitoxin system Phd/YefM family antitoxin n=1 Tax=Candidatus Chlorohelix sp. TaxID=3139201 RepID=UPI00303E6276
MGKEITTTQLRAELSHLLDMLDSGETHFIIKRNNQASAVLLSMDKFRDIMQTLETLRTLEFIGQPELEAGSLQDYLNSLLRADNHLSDENNLPLQDEFSDETPESPSLVSLPGNPDKEKETKVSREGSVEEAAAKLGIRLIK